ncbi:MAG: hypothetical protein GY801_39750 [bacterium]|nr:hypothetical protein [bacterium]
MFREKKNTEVLYYSILGLCLSALLLSCGDPIGGQGTSQVFLSVQAADIYGVSSDVYDPTISGNVSWDTTDVVVKSIYRDSTGGTQTDFADILLQEQRVTYFRTDGNSDVPAPFMITLPSNLVPNGGELDLEIVIVRSDAKLKSPLKELAFGGGEGEIYMSALVQFYGKDLAGNSAYGEITIPIWAKDY